jgi:hypothetical protein
MSDDRLPDSGEVTACRERLTAVLAEVWEVAERGGPDFSWLVAEALQMLSAELRGAGLLIRSRPVSWEAAAVASLSATLDDDWGVSP